MAEVLDLENKIKAVSDTTTETELSILKTELSIHCMAPEKLESLRAIVEAKNTLKEDTKVKLRDLLKDCTLPESKETKESKKAPFEQVFEGTKSEMFSADNIQLLKKYIISRFEKFPNLTLLQRENLATATLAKLVSGDILNTFLKGATGKLTNIVDILATLTGDSAPKEPTSAEKEDKKTKSETGMNDMLAKLKEMLDTAIQPLISLLEKTPAPVGLVGFLDNPKEMAKYDGSGNIRPDIIAMTNDDRAEFTKQLHEKVLNIDGQIISLQALKEKGMDFIAIAPSWVQSILTWLLKSVFGDFLASFLGYANGKEALTGMGEELKQRKSIVDLRQFGDITSADEQGKEQKKPGKRSKEIKMLEGKDLSKIDRKKLNPFFEFTQVEKVDINAKDFWTDIFNNKKIIGKDTDGKETSYVVAEIKEDDLKDDFKGFYEKLNGLKKATKDTKAQADAASEAQKAATEKAQQEQTRMAKTEAARLAQTEVQPYKDLDDGMIINSAVVQSLKSLTIQDFRDGNYANKAKKILEKNPNRDTIMSVLALYASILTDEKVNTYIQTLGNPVNFETLSFQRHKLLAQTGRTSEWFQQRETKVTDGKKAEDEAKTVKSEGEKQIGKADCIARRDTAIRDAIHRTTVFPVPLPGWDVASIARGKELLVEYPTGVISFDATKGEIHIGEKKFSLVVKPFTKFGMNITDAKITAIIIKGDHFELAGKSEKWGSGDPISVSKGEMSELLIALLNGNTNKTKFSDKIAFASVGSVVV